MNIIVPAIIPKSFAELEEKVGQIHSACSLAQIDVCDGKFTPDKNWPLVGDSGEFEEIKAEKRGLPFWQEMDYEIHLMTKTPQDEVSDWVKAGAMRILVHIEEGSDAIMNILEEWGHTIEIGIVANMTTSVSLLEAFFDKVTTIQLMSIGVVGHQGEPFDEKVIDKIKELREIGYKHKISIDGGINLENAAMLIENGADRLVVGSAIWQSDNPVEMVEILEKIQKS